MKILMVLTSHDRLGDTGNKTGFWLEEFAAPYYVFLDAGAEVVLASPDGGRPPLDPNSDSDDAQTDATRRFKDDAAAQQALDRTHKLTEVDPQEFDAVFFPGGHGPMWDLAESDPSRRLIESFVTEGRPVAAVCHAPAVFRHVQDGSGAPLVKGRRVTGFTNSEEEGVGLSDVVPFLLEDMLKEQGARFERAEDWSAHVVVDGKLITGQNPASSGPAAEKLLELLR